MGSEECSLVFLEFINSCCFLADLEHQTDDKADTGTLGGTPG